MPLGKGVRYRWVKRGGKMIRLAFRGKKKVVETKVKGHKAKRVTRKKKKTTKRRKKRKK